MRAVRACLPFLRASGGRILANTSLLAKAALDGLILSNVFRLGVLGLVRSLATELAPDGILVNAIAPGKFDTERVAALDRARAQRAGSTAEAVRAATEAGIRWAATALPRSSPAPPCSTARRPTPTSRASSSSPTAGPTRDIDMMTNSHDFRYRGVLPILPTPFNDDDRIDFDSLGRLLDFLALIGVDGVTVLGVLGEGSALTDDEAREVVRFACGSGSGLPVVVGASRPSPYATRAITEFAAEVGAAAVMVAPPSVEGLLEGAVWAFFAEAASESLR